MYSTTMRYTGLSGIDTASMVTQLMKAESYKYNNLFKANLKTQYQQEAYQSVGNKLLEIQTNKFNLLSSSSFRSTSTYNGLRGSLTSSNGTASSSATVKASSSASTGKYSFTVDQLATSDKITLQPVNQGVAKAAEDVDFEGLASLEKGGTINLTVNSTSKAISFSQEELSAINDPTKSDSEKLENLKTALNDKIKTAFGTSDKASFEINNGKLELKANVGNTAKMTDTGKTGLMGNLGFNTVSTTTGKSSGSTTTGGSVSAGNGFDISNLANITKDTTISLSINGTTKNLTFDELDLEALQNGDIATEESFTELMNNKIEQVFGAGSTDKAKFSIKDGAFALTAEKGHSASVNKSASVEGAMTGAEILGFDTTKSHSTAKTVAPTSISDIFGVTEDLNFSINGKSFSFTADTSLDSFLSQLNGSGAGIQASYSETSGKLALESTSTGLSNAIKFDSAGEDFFLNGGGFKGEPVRAEAKDAKITLNGTEITRENNSFSVDGISFNLNSVSEATETINVTKDYSGVSDKLKELVEVYNSMLTAIYDQTSNARPKSSTGATYEPLTEDERAEMTETQIKEWDEKAKKGLLYKDSTLAEAESALRNAMSTPVTLSDGSKLMLSDFGISLGDWSQKGLLVIDEDKMAAGIEKHGDKISEFMTSSGSSYGSTGIAERLNNALNSVVGTKGTLTQKVGLSSSAYYTASNEYKNKIADNAKSLADLLTSLQKKEDQYYKQFAAMEAAITQSNNQLSSISGLFA